MTTTTPPGFAEYTVQDLRRRRGGNIFDVTEYKKQNAVILYRGQLLIEVLTNRDYEIYCEVAGLDPHDMPHLEVPKRDGANGVLPRLNWDEIDAPRFALDATFVINELREIRQRITHQGTHVRALRFGHSSGVLVPPTWAAAQRAALTENENGEPVNAGGK